MVRGYCPPPPRVLCFEVKEETPPKVACRLSEAVPAQLSTGVRIYSQPSSMSPVSP